jgi:hypothetical protein
VVVADGANANIACIDGTIASGRAQVAADFDRISTKNVSRG